MTIVKRLETETTVGLIAVALTGIAVFPLLGNAAALFVGLPRRSVQIALLAILSGMLLFGAGVGGYRLIAMPFIASRWRIRWVLPIVVCFTLLRLSLALQAGQWPSKYAIVAAMLTIAWLTLLILHLIHRMSPPRFTAGAPAPTNFQQVFVATLTLVALIGYFMGPDPDNAYMAFRGSTTQSGAGSAILAAIAMAFLRGWYRFAGLLLSLYLNFLATSRTGLLLVLLLSAIVMVTRAATNRGGIARMGALMRDLGLFAACAAIAVIPATWSFYYPYASSRPGPAGAHILYKSSYLTDGEGLAMRYTRVLRLVKDPTVLVDLPFSEIHRLEREGVADSRWLVWQSSFRAIATSPLGFWPRPFDRQTQIYCGRPPICPYPHNLVLEVGYHFGWLPIAVMVLGLAVLIVRAAFALLDPDLLVRASSILFLGHLGFAQFSGNLLDHTFALIFGVIFTARYTQFASTTQATANEKA